MTKEDYTEYLATLYGRLLEHRYRYYILAHPVLDDWLYDWIEKYYNNLAIEAGVKMMDMVDFNVKDPLAIEAQKRVDSGTDSYSIWEKEMLPVWERLGRPKYHEGKENEKS